MVVIGRSKDVYLCPCRPRGFDVVYGDSGHIVYTMGV